MEMEGAVVGWEELVVYAVEAVEGGHSTVVVWEVVVGWEEDEGGHCEVVAMAVEEVR